MRRKILISVILCLALTACSNDRTLNTNNEDNEVVENTATPEAPEASVTSAPETAEVSVTDAPGAAEASVTSAPETAEVSVTSAPETTEASVTSAPEAAEVSVTSAPETTEASVTSAPETTKAPITGTPEITEAVIESGSAETYYPASLPLEGQNSIQIIDEAYYENITSENSDNGADEVKPITGGTIPKEVIYPVTVADGSEVSLDLDGNGTIDSICIDVTSRSIKVNNYEYGDRDGDGLLEDYQIYPDSPSAYGYYITDIDVKDKYKEIAFIEFGPSDDPYSYFFRFDQGKLEYIGGIPFHPFNVEGYYSRNKDCFDGAGKIHGNMRLSVFQTWWAPVDWKLNDEGKLELIKQDWYYPGILIYKFRDEKQNYNPKILEEIKVYEAPDTDSAQLVLEPNDSIVYFLATDNREWVWLKREDGTGGFLYLPYYNKLSSELRQEAFSNLCMAD